MHEGLSMKELELIVHMVKNEETIEEKVHAPSRECWQG